jgi:RNA polymerase sigma factor (TIGR02999 family)
MNDVTRILSAIEEGDPLASEQLLPLVYDELRRLAVARLAREKPGQTLQATALVNEAYLRLVDNDKAQHWNSRGHFFAAAANAMRRILIDNARRKMTERHGGGRGRVELDAVEAAARNQDEELLALHEALDLLAAEKPIHAKVVEMRYFGGYTNKETAEYLNITIDVANDYFAFAKNWLRVKLGR